MFATQATLDSHMHIDSNYFNTNINSVTTLKSEAGDQEREIKIRLRAGLQ